MSSGSYKQQEVKCPFYQYDDGRKTIVCEGFADGCVIDLRWKTHVERYRHMDVFCCQHFKNCEIYRAVYEAKYDD